MPASYDRESPAEATAGAPCGTLSSPGRSCRPAPLCPGERASAAFRAVSSAASVIRVGWASKAVAAPCALLADSRSRAPDSLDTAGPPRTSMAALRSAPPGRGRSGARAEERFGQVQGECHRGHRGARGREPGAPTKATGGHEPAPLLQRPNSHLARIHRPICSIKCNTQHSHTTAQTCNIQCHNTARPRPRYKRPPGAPIHYWQNIPTTARHRCQGTAAIVRRIHQQMNFRD